MKLVLAFDIERSGTTVEYETIAIGASVVDENLKELDNFLYLNYYPIETQILLNIDKYDKICNKKLKM